MKSTGKPSASDVPLSGEELAQARAMERMGATGIVRTQTSYQTAIAVQVPRDLDRVVERCHAEAKATAGPWFYRWTVTNKDRSKSVISGTSIEGAMVMVRNWTNSACEVLVEEEGPTHWTLRATVIDLETGFTSTRLYRQRKGERHGKFDDDRAQDIAFQIGQSKAVRNAILKALPAWLVRDCMEVAATAAIAKIEQTGDLQAVARKAVVTFKTLGVEQAALERRVGRLLSDWTAKDLARLHAIGRALREKVTAPDKEFTGAELTFDAEDATASSADTDEVCEPGEEG